MVTPERRTRGDLLVAAAIVVVIAVAAALVWWSSDARATISKPAAEPVPAVVGTPTDGSIGRVARSTGRPAAATTAARPTPTPR